MQWQDQAIILGVKRLGETSVIAEVMTRDRGRHMGLVRSGRSRAMQPVLQAGNLVEVTWRARLHEHLGEFRMEPVRLRAARLMETATAVYGVQAMGALLRLLPERDPHPHLYDALDVILENLQNPMDAGELFVRFELGRAQRSRLRSRPDRMCSDRRARRSRLRFTEDRTCRLPCGRLAMGRQDAAAAALPCRRCRRGG